ncbi:cyclic nucleotide-binding domain-containing protein [Magnetococcales bacterium HHB-1]
MLIIKLMETIPFFCEFSVSEREIFAGNENLFATYQPEEYLIREHDTDDAFYVLLKGTVSVTCDSHPNQELAQLKAGSVIGEMSFLTKAPRTSNVVAKQEVIAFRIDGKMMAQQDPSLQVKTQNQLLKLLVHRLEQVNADLAKQKEINTTLIKALRTKHQL